ncbi:MAG: TolC family protein [Gemmatimonadales bacterium]
MRSLLLAVGLGAGPALVAAQAPVSARLSLADAIAIARQNSPTYRAALNDRGPAGWAVRSAWSSLFLPSFTASGGIGYAGPGEQNFLTSSFSQDVSTLSSFYDLGLSWQLSGATLSQPGLEKARQRATEADIAGADNLLTTSVTEQYLTVLQAGENLELARKTLERNEEFLKLARAQFAVGQRTLIDVRRAQVARGQADVAQLRAETVVSVEKLRLFERLGVVPPTDIAAVVLTDTFPVEQPRWRLDELLAMAERENPSLNALRARETAADWGVRSATSSYGPTVSLSAGWSGFTQKFTDLDPIIRNSQALFGAQYAQCNDDNVIRQNAGLPPNDCSAYIWGSDNEQALRAANATYPFDFTRQPFQARLGITLPIFTNFSRQRTISETREQRDDVTEAVRARALGLRTDVSQAFLALDATYRAVAIQDTNRTAGAEQLQLATDRYRVGSGTFFELIDAQVAALRADFDYIAAVYDYHRAVTVLEAAVGRRLR